MKIILHAGAHATDDNRLVKGLLRNHDAFAGRGIAVPRPGSYRNLLSQTIFALDHGTPDPEAREVLVEAFCDDAPENIDRLLLSHENLFSTATYAVGAAGLYEKAEIRLSYLRALFPGDEIQLYFALRDPATWLPALFAASPAEDFLDFMAGADPLALRWSDLVARLREAHPEVPLTLWCNEDTPFLWGAVIRAMAGLPEGEKITGAFDLLAQIMDPEGMQRFRAYLKKHPNMTEPQKRRAMAAFLDKYYLDEAVEEELDLPGWTDETVAAITATYEEDVARIAKMEGVTLLMP